MCMIEDALVKSEEDAAPLDTSASARLADWNDPPGLFHPAPEAVVKLEPPPRDTGAAGGSSFATGGVSGLGLGLGAAPAKPKPANERAERDASGDEYFIGYGERSEMSTRGARFFLWGRTR